VRACVPSVTRTYMHPYSPSATHALSVSLSLSHKQTNKARTLDHVLGVIIGEPRCAANQGAAEPRCSDHVAVGVHVGHHREGKTVHPRVERAQLLSTGTQRVCLRERERERERERVCVSKCE
jgi:hypothetical protein